MAAAALLGGCASVPLFTARDDIHRFFVAVRDNDQATFDSLVDQDNLSRGIATQECFAKDPGLAARRACIEAVGSLRPVPLSAFRGIAASLGYETGRRSSGPVGLPLGHKTHDLVCVRTKAFGDCLLQFLDRPGGWRLAHITDPTRLDGR